MKKTTISVAEATRNFADGVNRVHYQNMTFILLKNGEPVAQLTPDNEKVCTGRVLVQALAGSKLAESEANAWRSDLLTARKALIIPAD